MDSKIFWGRRKTCSGDNLLVIFKGKSRDRSVILTIDSKELFNMREVLIEQMNSFSSITSITTLLCHLNLSSHKLENLNEHSLDCRQAEVFLDDIRFLTHDQIAMHVLGEEWDEISCCVYRCCIMAIRIKFP